LIVRRAEHHLFLITQPDHAALAAGLMAEWQADGLPSNPRRETLLLATREHDNGWRELDTAPLVDESGQIRDFLNMPQGTHTAVWPRAIRRLRDTPYAAALVAQHALHLFRDHRGEAAYESFFREVEQARDDRLGESALDLDALMEDYFIVRMGDLISLTFCNGWSEPQREGRYTVRAAESRLLVEPDPFGGREIRIAIPARRIEARPYGHEEAQAAFAAAAAELVTGTAGGI
jgi:hypothetical protein